MEGAQRRFVPYNGLVQSAQLQWLRRELECHCNVIIFSHVPLHPLSAVLDCLVWNYDEVSCWVISDPIYWIKILL